SSFGCAGAGSGRRPIYPDGGDSKRLGRNHIVINALSNVKDLVRGNSDPGQSHFEAFEARLVTTSLPGRNNVVERYFELRGGGSEQIVIYIGDHSKLMVLFQFEKEGYGVREGAPGGERFWERTHLGRGGSKSQTLSKAADDGLQYFTIRLEFSLFSFGFEGGVHLQEGGVGDGFAMCRE